MMKLLTCMRPCKQGLTGVMNYVDKEISFCAKCATHGLAHGDMKTEGGYQMGFPRTTSSVLAELAAVLLEVQLRRLPPCECARPLLLALNDLKLCKICLHCKL